MQKDPHVFSSTLKHKFGRNQVSVLRPEFWLCQGYPFENTDVKKRLAWLLQKKKMLTIEHQHFTWFVMPWLCSWGVYPVNPFLCVCIGGWWKYMKKLQQELVLLRGREGSAGFAHRDTLCQAESSFFTVLPVKGNRLAGRFALSACNR